MSEPTPEAEAPVTPEPSTIETVARLAAEAAARAVPDPSERLDAIERAVAEIRETLAAAAGPQGGSAKLTTRLRHLEKALAVPAVPADNPLLPELIERLGAVEQALAKTSHLERTAP